MGKRWLKENLMYASAASDDSEAGNFKLDAGLAKNSITGKRTELDAAIRAAEGEKQP